jgi:hypothetical protein
MLRFMTGLRRCVSGYIPNKYRKRKGDEGASIGGDAEALPDTSTQKVTASERSSRQQLGE